MKKIGDQFWREIFSIAFILIVAILVPFDLFAHAGRPVTFDGPTHIVTIAQFYHGLQQGQFPVRWADNYAKYGLPLPILSQQFTSYLGAVLMFVTHNATVAYNLEVLLSAVSLGLLTYWLGRRLGFSGPVALVGSTLLQLAPYRLINIYSRGALAEVFFTSWLVLAAGALTYWRANNQKSWRLGFGLLTLASAGMALTHPMLLLPAGLVLAILLIWAAWPVSRRWKQLLLMLVSGVLGLLLASYYLLPLKYDFQFFYYGLGGQELTGSSAFLEPKAFFVPQWPYGSTVDTGPRVQYFHFGEIENVILLIGLAASVGWLFVRQKPRADIDSRRWLWALCLTSVGLILLLFPISQPIHNLPLFRLIEHPWRMQAALLVLPPLLAMWLLNKLKPNWQVWTAAGMLLLTLALRVPQLYGKNYLDYDDHFNQVTDANLHGNKLNTIWMGATVDYPIQATRSAIIEGQGTIKDLQVGNGWRRFQLDATTDVRLVDYTFYFPGWKVWSDGTQVPIEFQDPGYRGVITYRLPAGTHLVELRFTNTKVRLLGNLLSLGTLMGLIANGVWHSRRSRQSR